MAMSLECYISRANCPESDGIKAELRECIRKLHIRLEYPADDEPRVPSVAAWEQQRTENRPEPPAPIYSHALDDEEHEIEENSDLFK